MTTTRYPLYGKLYSIGDYVMPDSCESYMSEDPFVFTPQAVYYTGEQYQQDGYGGGAAPLNSACSWYIAIKPPDGTSAPDKGPWVEGQYEALRTLVDTPHIDGSSGRILTITVWMQDGTQASAPAELVSAPVRSADRHQGQIWIVTLNAILHGQFTQ